MRTGATLYVIDAENAETVAFVLATADGDKWAVRNPDQIGQLLQQWLSERELDAAIDEHAPTRFELATDTDDRTSYWK